jgi:hypothetical protein
MLQQLIYHMLELLLISYLTHKNRRSLYHNVIVSCIYLCLLEAGSDGPLASGRDQKQGGGHKEKESEI